MTQRGSRGVRGRNSGAWTAAENERSSHGQGEPSARMVAPPTPDDVHASVRVDVDGGRPNVVAAHGIDLSDGSLDIGRQDATRPRGGGEGGRLAGICAEYRYNHHDYFHHRRLSFPLLFLVFSSSRVHSASPFPTRSRFNCTYRYTTPSVRIRLYTCTLPIPISGPILRPLSVPSESKPRVSRLGPCASLPRCSGGSGWTGRKGVARKPRRGVSGQREGERGAGGVVRFDPSLQETARHPASGTH